MKCVAVILYDLSVEYNYTVVNGISSYFENRDDVRLLISSVKTPHDKGDCYDYQFWTSMEILKSQDVDGYIIVPNSFSNHLDIKIFQDNIQDITNKPVVSVAIPVNLPGSKYTYVSCEKCYIDIVHHLITKHNRKKFAFFSAELAYSPEGKERFEAYKKALEANNIEFNPDYVLPGDFTPGTARDYVLNHYSKVKKLPFDAILCANDHTAVGCAHALLDLGFNVPKDVSIFGFDDSSVATQFYPTTSTVNQDVGQSGYQAARMIDEITDGKSVPEKVKIDTFPVFRQSCGCIDASIQTNSYIDYKGNYHGVDEKKELESRMEAVAATQNLEGIYKLLNMMDSIYTSKTDQTVLQSILDLTKVSALAICLYPQIIDLNREDDFELPESAFLSVFVNKEKNICQLDFEQQPQNSFNPKKQIIPKNLKGDEAGPYFIIPIFLRNKNYGYMVCKFETKNSYLVSIYSKVITNSVIQTYEFQKSEKIKQKLLQKTENLDIQSKTDELTQIFNRRGFMEYGQRLLDLSVSIEQKGYVFFCDMDGLKLINDTYGHETGDLAIKTQALILKKAFRDTDLIGRLSGDEFGVVAPGFKIKCKENLYARIASLSLEESEKAGLPFTLSISLGEQHFDEDIFDLRSLLIEADKNLYKEKQIKHSKK